MARTKISSGDAVTAGRPAAESTSGPEPEVRPPTPTPTRRRIQRSEEVAPGATADVVGEAVTVTWGEEKISPKPGSFSSCTFGPYVYTTRVQPGETVEQAFQRAYAIVRSMAEAFRHQKLRSFLQALRDAASDVAAINA